MKARPEDDRETANIGHPSEFADDSGEDWWAVVLELLEDVTCGLQRNTASRDDDGPEVQPTVSFESHIDKDEELNAHPVCQCAEGGNEAEGNGALKCQSTN